VDTMTRMFIIGLPCVFAVIAADRLLMWLVMQ